MKDFVSFVIEEEEQTGSSDGTMEGGQNRTFNCRIIFIDEMALYQLNCQTRLSDTTTAYNDELVLSQELCR